MSKEILTFGNIEIEKKIFCHKSPVPLRDINIENVVAFKRFLLEKKTINTLLATGIMIIKLSYYI